MCIVFDILFSSKQLEDSNSLKTNNTLRNLALKLELPEYAAREGDRSNERYEHSFLIGICKGDRKEESTYFTLGQKQD